MKQRGLVIALSGIDSAGKSTQRELLLEYLHRSGLKPTKIWTRAGYTPRLRLTKHLLRAIRGKKKNDRGVVSKTPGHYPRRTLNLQNPIHRWLWLTTALLDLVWTYNVQIRWGRACGRTYVCDRYLLDVLVDFRANFPDDNVEQRWLCRLLRWGCVQPDLAFCLMLPAWLSIERSQAKARFHWETRQVIQQRFLQYSKLSNELGVIVVDAEQAIDVVTASLQAELNGLLTAPPPAPPS